MTTKLHTSIFLSIFLLLFTLSDVQQMYAQQKDATKQVKKEKKKKKKKKKATEGIEDNTPKEDKKKFIYGDSDVDLMIGLGQEGDGLDEDTETESEETKELIDLMDLKEADAPAFTDYTESEEWKIYEEPLDEWLQARETNADFNLSDKATELSFFKNVERDNSIIKQHKILEGPDARTIYLKKNDTLPTYGAKDYDLRLKLLNTDIPLTYNAQVGAFIEMYLLEKRDQVRRILPKSDMYFPIFERALERYGLPLELKYLPVVESALIPHATSGTGRAGLWQLNFQVARRYNLTADAAVDERRDPLLSTEAAVQHLKELHKKYQNWYVVIAAYNMGEGEIEKAIKRAGDSKNYWKIAQFLPKIARSYVPLYIAAIYVLNYYPEHNIERTNPPYLFYSLDTVQVKSKLKIKQICQQLDMEVKELLFLNPALRKETIPQLPKGYPLTLPTHKIGLFEGFLRSLRAAQTDVVLGVDKEDMELPKDNPLNYEMDDYGFKYTGQKNLKTKIVYYVVKKEEKLKDITQIYDCTIADIMRWNKLETEYVAEGQRLVLYLLEEVTPKAGKVENPKINLPDETTKILNEIPGEKRLAVVYEVKEGDNLKNIARQYPFITAEDICKANAITARSVKPGRILYIPMPLPPPPRNKK